MDAALEILRNLFSGKTDKLDKKIIKSSSTTFNKPANVKSTPLPKAPQTAKERAKIQRLVGRKVAKKPPVSRGADVGDGAREGRGESIQIGTGGIAELVPNSGAQGGHGGHGNHGAGAAHTYSSYDGGGGDGGGGC